MTSSPALHALTASKQDALLALADAKYDKIVHVRQAANRAIQDVESLPNLVPIRKADSMRDKAVGDLLGPEDSANDGSSMAAEDQHSSQRWVAISLVG